MSFQYLATYANIDSMCFCLHSTHRNFSKRYPFFLRTDQQDHGEV